MTKRVFAQPRTPIKDGTREDIKEDRKDAGNMKLAAAYVKSGSHKLSTLFAHFVDNMHFTRNVMNKVWYTPRKADTRYAKSRKCS